MSRALNLMPDEPEDEYVPDSLEHQWRQIEEARREIERPTSQYLDLPYHALAELVGALAPGEVHIATAFSGGGKTLFTANIEHAFLTAKRTMYHIGLETKPALVRLHFACLRLQDQSDREGMGLNFYLGDIVSGAAKSWPRWPEMERMLRAEINTGFHEDYPLVVNRERWLDLPRLTKALEEAAFYGAHLVVIDHMDHLATPDHQSLYQASVQVTRRLVEMTQDLQLRVLALSQLNNEAVRGDLLQRYMPPRPEQVYMGGHKRQVCSSMLGLFRPLDPDLSQDDLKLARAGKLEPMQVVQPHVLAAVLMKSRNYGNREGRVVKLAVRNGRLSDLTQSAERS